MSWICLSWIALDKFESVLIGWSGLLRRGCKRYRSVCGLAGDWEMGGGHGKGSEQQSPKKYGPFERPKKSLLDGLLLLVTRY